MQRKLDLRTGRPVWTVYRAPAVPTGRLNSRRQHGCSRRRHGHRRRAAGGLAYRRRPRCRSHRSAGRDEGLDAGHHCLDPVRDRPAALRSLEEDRARQGGACLAALAAGARFAEGTDRRIAASPATWRSARRSTSLAANSARPRWRWKAKHDARLASPRRSCHVPPCAKPTASIAPPSAARAISRSTRVG